MTAVMDTQNDSLDISQIKGFILGFHDVSAKGSLPGGSACLSSATIVTLSAIAFACVEFCARIVDAIFLVGTSIPTR